MSVSISPLFNEAQYFNNDGTPLSGGKIFQYEAGSFSVAQTTYSDESGNIANPNPIVLDSSGRSPYTLYLTNGSAYNLVLTLPDGTTILNSSDFVVGVLPAPSGSVGISVWNTLTEVPTYVSPTSFLIPGVNLVSSFAISNRVRITYTDTSTAFGTVTSVNFSGGNTNVSLNTDAGSLLTNMDQVAWSSLVANGITVDSGAVSYKTNISYPSTTIGGRLNQINATLSADTAASNARITRNAQWVSANYTSAYNYVATLSPAPTSLSEPQVFTVIFIQSNSNILSNSNPATLNVNGLGAAPLQQYDANGNFINPRITAYMTSLVVWTGSVYHILNPLIPATPAGTITNSVEYGAIFAPQPGQSGSTATQNAVEFQGFTNINPTLISVMLNSSYSMNNQTGNWGCRMFYRTDTLTNWVLFRQSSISAQGSLTTSISAMGAATTLGLGSYFFRFEFYNDFNSSTVGTITHLNVTVMASV
jgi:hypothetical protein